MLQKAETRSIGFISDVCELIREYSNSEQFSTPVSHRYIEIFVERSPAVRAT